MGMLKAATSLFSKKRYEILDNGGMPYLVRVMPGGKGVKLYMQVFFGNLNDPKNLEYHWKTVPPALRPNGWKRMTSFGPIKITNVKKVFVGVDNTCAVPLRRKYAGNYCSTEPLRDNRKRRGPMHGNTLLLHARGGEYVVIGGAVSVIDIGDDVITHFYSPVGNSGTPYPYAVGKKYVYLLSDLGDPQYSRRKLKTEMSEKCGMRIDPDMDEMLNTGSPLPVLKVLLMRGEMPSKNLPVLFDFAKMKPWSEQDRVNAGILAIRPVHVWPTYSRTKQHGVRAVSMHLGSGEKKVSFASYARNRPAMNKLSLKLVTARHRKEEEEEERIERVGLKESLSQVLAKLNAKVSK